MRISRVVLSAALAVLGGWFMTDTAHGATVLYEGRTVEVANTLEDPTDLWVTPDDLTKINGFVIKPEGACLDEICIPLTEASGLTTERLGQKWINVTGLAQKLNQPYTHDAEAGAWSFAPLAATHESYLTSAEAPDFALKDREGKTVHLSDFRGKKVLLMTWASW